MPQNFKNFIFVFIVLLLFTNIQSIRAEEKAIQQGLSTEEWMRCAAKVIDEFDNPVKECMKWTYSQAEYKNCEKIKNERKEAFDKEIEGRCGIAPKGKTISPNPTEQSVQDQFSNNNSSGIPNYTQALVIEPPKESDFQKVPKSDFKKVNPISTASAMLKSASESANITGSVFIGKVDGDGVLILQLPNGKGIELTADKSAFEGERPSGFRFRDFKGSGNNYTAPKRHVYVKEIDCNILLEQERRDQEMIKRTGGITYASDWGVDDTIIVKPTGDCSYTNEGGPIRVLAEKGQVTFKTPGDTAVSANNADFGIGYNVKSAISIVEVYNGSITVTNKAGQSKTISATYGSEIKQVEVDKDGVMGEKIAIPLSQWKAFLVGNQEKTDKAKDNTLPIVGTVAVLGIAGIVLFLYRTGKLIPLYKISSQKIAGMLQKISKEKKTD